jgi:uncharacterized oxidoreductase
MELREQTILITGGSSGLGFELAARLRQLGNTVIITGRNAERLAEARRRLPGLHALQSDVSDPAAIRRLCEEVTARFPRLNVLVNNAGEMRRLNLNDPALDPLDLTREVDINLAGPIRMVQQFLPHLKAQPTAAILNVTSGLALVPFPLSPVYGATKAGLRSYTKSLRVQLQGTRVKVFELVAPAADTPLSDKFKDDMDTSALMEPGKLVARAIRGLQRDEWEIYPGLARVMHLLSRLAPGFLLRQMSKPAEKAFGAARK